MNKWSTILFCLVALLCILIPIQIFAESTSILQCTLNSVADRSFDENHGWVGSLPKLGEKPDPSLPFNVATKTFTKSGFIFAGLDTASPRIRPVMDWRDEVTGNPVLGVERNGTLIRRTPTTVFVLWEFAPNEFYLAVLHLKSRKAAIGNVSTGALYHVAAEAMTADCQ